MQMKSLYVALMNALCSTILLMVAVYYVLLVPMHEARNIALFLFIGIPSLLIAIMSTIFLTRERLRQEDRLLPYSLSVFFGSTAPIILIFFLLVSYYLTFGKVCFPSTAWSELEDQGLSFHRFLTLEGILFPLFILGWWSWRR
jgi:hypothetical protein